MSHAEPNPPCPCYLPPVKAQPSEKVKAIIVEISSSEAPKNEEYSQDISIGRARKNGIAILIVLTNLVPVSPSILVSILR